MNFGSCARVVAFAVASGGVLAPQVQAAEVFRGQLYCRGVKVLNLPNVVDLRVTITGGAVAFEREMPGQDFATDMPWEKGSGSLSNGSVRMTGGGSTNAWRMDSVYDGRLSAEGLNLQGTQVWRGAKLAEAVPRSCDALLVR